MNTITFPGFNLKININRIAFTIFGVEVYWYALLIVTAMVIAIIIFKLRDGLYKIKFNDILDLLIWLIPISVISARIYYVLFNLEYYLSNPIQIINTRNGGMAIYGGIIGGAITCFVFYKKRKLDLLNLIDYIVPGLVLGQAIGRWGNFINAEAYGSQTNLPWRMGIYKMGEYIEVHPTFLYESLACFIIFIILVLIKNKRKFKGQISLMYLSLYSFERTFVEGLRVDSLMLGKVRISQMLSIIIFITSIIVLVISLKKCRKNTENINN